MKDERITGSDRGLSDEEREETIRNLGALMVSAMEMYEKTGDFGYRGDADRLRMRMEALIKARPHGFARRLELERGLA